MSIYSEFITRFGLLTEKNKFIVANTLSNIFTMREIGNKTHGDMAEVGIVEFINQFMYDYKSKHVGKDLYRAKEHEEDIVITNELTKVSFPVSLKAYGDGPLQLSTDKSFVMFKELGKYGPIIKQPIISAILSGDSFSDLFSMNLMPLIYREKERECNILIFNFDKVLKEVCSIEYQDSGSGRKHPVYIFLDNSNEYICEVRYGGPSANALQRGFWTNTKRAINYFTSATGGWIKYETNSYLVKLIMLALNSTKKAHIEANTVLQNSIDTLKSGKKDD